MLRSRAGTHWPKSMSLTWADDVSRMLLPLTSRCMTRWAWRWLSAWHNISSSSQLMSHSIQTYRPIHVDRSTLDANSHHGRKTDGVGRRQLMRTLVKNTFDWLPLIYVRFGIWNSFAHFIIASFYYRQYWWNLYEFTTLFAPFVFP